MALPWCGAAPLRALAISPFSFGRSLRHRSQEPVALRNSRAFSGEIQSIAGLLRCLPSRSSLSVNRVIQQSRFRILLLFWMLGCLGVALASLLASYRLVDSEAWRCAFHAQGWAIEFGRILILILFSAYLLGDVFRREAMMLLFGRPAGSRFVAVVRRFTLVLFVAEAIALLCYALFWAPELLREGWPVEKPDWNTYGLPYLAYLPYSVVLYLFTFLPVLVVGLFGSLRDLDQLQRQYRRLKQRLEALLVKAINLRVSQVQGQSRSDGAEAALLAHQEAISNEALYQFGSFCINFLDIYGRYAAVILFWSISIVYEVQIGYQTTLERSRTIGWSGFLVSLGVLLVVSLGYLHYERAYARTSDLLTETARVHPGSGGMDVLEFEQKYSLFHFISRRFLNRHLGVVIALVICLSLPPVSLLLNRIKEVWPG